MEDIKTHNFIARSKLKHGEKYDYSKTIYNGSKYNVTIICPKHGEFEQLASNHSRGMGCSECGKKRIDTETFIKKANIVHQNKYDYSNTKYVDPDEKVKILCPKHGEFEQKARYHLDGNGCSDCSKKILKMDTKSYITNAKLIHGEKYKYTNTKYNGSHKDVTITCPKHGDFQTRASSHLSGSGCSSCTKTKKMDTNTFINKAKIKHGEKYDYSKVKIINSNDKVTIICNVHGEFHQRPSAHLYGNGCAHCKTNKVNT